MAYRQIICAGLLALTVVVSLPAMAAKPAGGRAPQGARPAAPHPGSGAATIPGGRVKPKPIDKPKVIRPKPGDRGWRAEDPIDDKPAV